MIDLFIAIDLEDKYRRWMQVEPAAWRLDDSHPRDTRRVFIQLYRAFPSDLLLEYEVTASERSVA